MIGKGDKGHRPKKRKSLVYVWTNGDHPHILFPGCIVCRCFCLSHLRRCVTWMVLGNCASGWPYNGAMGIRVLGESLRDWPSRLDDFFPFLESELVQAIFFLGWLSVLKFWTYIKIWGWLLSFRLLPAFFISIRTTIHRKFSKNFKNMVKIEVN